MRSRVRINRLIAALLLLGAMPAGAAQVPSLTDIQVQDFPWGKQFIFICSGDVQHSSVYSADPSEILIYLRQATLANSQKARLRGELSAVLRIDRWMENPPVLQIAIPVPGRVPFDIENSNGVVTLRVKREGASEGAAPTPMAAPVLPEHMTRVSVPQENLLLDKLSSGEPLSVDFRQANISDVLRVLGRQNGLNIVTSDSITGKITVTLKDVTVEQALESILVANGYKFVIQNGVILVKPGKRQGPEELETRVYRLRYIDANNLKEAVTELISTTGKVKVLTTSFHNRKDVYDVNNNIPPSREKRYWLRSSVMLVTDTPAVLKAIDQLVKEIDAPVPQIMIEAKLIETAPQHRSELGIDWSKSLAAELFNEVVLDGSSVYRYSSRTKLPSKDGDFTFGTLNTSQFNAVLNYLQANMNTRLLSNPRILAMDNEPSDISVGTNFPIPQINRGVGGQGDIVTFTYKDVNITLRVIPHVTENGTITLYVNPIIEEVTGQVTIDKNFAPITSKREVDTVVKVKNGDTIVIGGMIKEKEVTSIDKVWLLGDIPLLGHLFRNKTTDKQQTDLLIFITPRIVGNNG